MFKEKIYTSYGFDNNTLTVPFSEIVVINKQEETDEDCIEEFDSDERIFQVTIKQKNVESHSVTLVTESVVLDFEKKYSDYLDYRLNICSNADAALSSLVANSTDFFSKLEERVETVLSSIVAQANEEIKTIVSNSSHILNENRQYNEKISEELLKLEKLNNLIDSFVVDTKE